MKILNTAAFFIVVSLIITIPSRIIAAMCPCCVPDDMSELHVGEEVSLNSVPLFDGTDFQFSSIKVDRIAVMFWASWCPSCVKELSNPDELTGLFKKHNIFLIGINMDYDQDSALGFVKEKGITFPNTFMSFELVDQFKSVIVLPKLVILDKSGKVLSIFHPESQNHIQTELTKLAEI